MCPNSGRILAFFGSDRQYSFRMSELDDLLDQLERTTQLPRGVLARVVGEVIEFQGETIDAFVRRRHRELQREGLGNEIIWSRISTELAERRFRAPTLTERQLRRLVYG
jgi:hypothetical protein